MEKELEPDKTSGSSTETDPYENAEKKPEIESNKDSKPYTQ